MAVSCNVADIEFDKKESKIPSWFRWCRTSNDLLKSAEQKLLSRIKSNVEAFFVPIFNGSCYIRTFVFRSHESSQESSTGKHIDADRVIPIVLIHGYGSGSALWCKNIDALAFYRPVYSMDVLGFGRSSRPSFPVDAIAVEEKWVKSIEEWRSSLNLEKFILLGHSLGGFLACSYALNHPNRIAHLILADPWGFVEDPLKVKVQSNKSAGEAWISSTLRHLSGRFYPLSFLRAAGPFGPSLIHYFRQDLRRFFDQRPIRAGEMIEVSRPEKSESFQNISHDNNIQSTNGEDDVFEPPSLIHKTVQANRTVSDKSSSDTLDSIDFEALDGSVALDYVYHINCQNPSGEIGFKSLCGSVGWPQRPMLDRIGQLDPNVPITFIYGSRSWIDLSSAYKSRVLLPTSYVDVKVIEGAGHQVYAQMSEEFNAYVNMIGHRVDNGDSFTPEVYNSNPDCTKTASINVTNKTIENVESHGSNSSTKGYNSRSRRKRSSGSSLQGDTSQHAQTNRYIQDSRYVLQNEEASDEASD
ncbi:unnamed protein product [Schistosoma turkestanicum]|nr:unnamed protein product [Schistosoma turkestanicum]